MKKRTRAGVSKQLATVYGVTPEEADSAVVAHLRSSNKDRLTSGKGFESHDQDRLGLSPEHQAQAADLEALTGNENGAEQSMDYIDSTNDSNISKTDSELKYERSSRTEANKAVDDAKQEGLYKDGSAEARAKFDNAKAVADTVKPHAKLEVADRPDPVHEARKAAAAVEREVFINAVLTHPMAGEAFHDWNDMKAEGVPSADRLSRDDAFEWVSSYAEMKHGEITESDLADIQRDIERRTGGYDENAIRSDSASGGTRGPSQSTSRGEGGNTEASGSGSSRIEEVPSADRSYGPGSSEAPVTAARTNTDGIKVAVKKPRRVISPPLYSVGTAMGDGEFNAHVNQSAAEKLNLGMSRAFGNDPAWRNAYVRQNLPEALSDVADGTKAAFGVEVIGVTGTTPQSNSFNGINYGGKLYVNLNSNVGYTNVIGHELYHEIAKKRPDLHQWFKAQAEKHFSGIPEYRAKYESSLGKNESRPTLDYIKEEMLADFTGDALSDPKFLSELASANPSIFTQLLTAITSFLRGAAARLSAKGLKSSQYFTEVESLRTHLNKVLVAHAMGKDLEQNHVPDDIKFSTRTEPNAPTHTTSAVNSALPVFVRDTVTNLGDAWSKIKPKLLTMHQLIDQYGDKMESLKTHVRNLDSMDAYQSQLQQTAEPVMMKWAKLKKDESAKLGKVMLDATTSGIHPDEDFKQGGNDHLTDEDLANYARVRASYRLLTPEAKEVYQDAKKVMGDFWQKRKDVYSEVVRAQYAPLIAKADAKEAAKLEKRRDAEIKSHEDKIRTIKGPYFPMMRDGDNLVVAESKELSDLRAQLKNTAGDDHAILLKNIEKMEAQQDKEGVAVHRHVSAYKLRSDADKAVEQLRARGLEVQEVRRVIDAQRNLAPMSAAGVEKINHLLDATLDKSMGDKAREAVAQMFLASLPEHHFLERQAKRKGIEGATEDMMKAFSEAANADTFALSRMKYAKDIAANLHTMMTESKANSALGDVFNNVQARLALDLSYKPTPIQNALARATSFWQLGISPAFVLQNFTQPWTVTLPQLAGRHGIGRTSTAMTAAWGDASRILKVGKDGLLNLNDMDLSDEGALAKGMDPKELKMLQSMKDLGQLTLNQNIDMGMAADGVSPTQLKFIKVFNWMTHHTELHNRVTTALTAYRLESGKLRAEGNLSPEEIQVAAHDAAYKAITETQLDYSNSNAAHFMKNGAVPMGKLIFQFRKYQQGMLYLIGRNAQLAFKGDPEAKKSLAYLMAMQGLVAGAMGVPVLTAGLAAWSLAMGGDDDDEEGNTETKLRNYLADQFGASAADVIWKGLPAMWGMDTSKTLGMGDVWNPLPFLKGSDLTEAKTGKDAMGQVLVNVAGASTGLMSTMWDGAKLMEGGDFQKGFEKIMPKWVANPVKAERYSDEGLTSRKGNMAVSPDQFDSWDIMFRAMGFSTTNESNHYDAQNAKENVSRAIKTRRESLLDDFAKAQLSGGDVGSARENIAEFNAEHSTKGNRIDAGTMLKAVQRRRVDARGVDAAGVSFRRNETNLKEIDRFAR